MVEKNLKINIFYVTQTEYNLANKFWVSNLDGSPMQVLFGPLAKEVIVVVIFTGR